MHKQTSSTFYISNDVDGGLKNNHCVKSVRIRSYSGPYFPAFGLNMERYSVSLHIQSKYGKMLTRITPNMDTFYAVNVLRRKKILGRNKKFISL